MTDYSERIKQPDVDRSKLSALLWPESNEQTRRVLIGRWINKGIKTVTLEQFRVLSEYFGEGQK